MIVVRDSDELVETEARWQSLSSTCSYLWFLMAFTAIATEWFLNINASPGPCKVTGLSYLHSQARHGNIVVTNKQAKCMI